MIQFIKKMFFTSLFFLIATHKNVLFIGLGMWDKSMTGGFCPVLNIHKYLIYRGCLQFWKTGLQGGV